eukprot:6077271-Pyramimonas_sp.AAC.1
MSFRSPPKRPPLFFGATGLPFPGGGAEGRCALSLCRACLPPGCCPCSAGPEAELPAGRWLDDGRCWLLPAEG